MLTAKPNANFANHNQNSKNYSAIGMRRTTEYFFIPKTYIVYYRQPKLSIPIILKNSFGQPALSQNRGG